MSAEEASPRRASRRRPRRTQEERSAETRAKVVAAATECVAELGFRGATMNAIAARAGVTWGAMQHQFGDKDAILDAVLENAVHDFEAQLSGLRDESEPRARVHAFVRHCEKLLRGPSYRAFFEIQSNRGRADDDAGASWAADVETALARIWKALFGGLGLPRARLVAARRFAFVVLSGIAAERMIFPRTDFSRSHLEVLEATLVRLLELEPATGRLR